MRILRSLFRRPRFRRVGQPGQAVVEFAFVLLPLTILTLALIDFARLWMHYQVVTDAAREGARMAVIADETEPSERHAAIFEAIKSSLGTVGIQTSGAQFFGDCQALSSTTPSGVEVYACGWDGERGEPATVSIRVPYEFPFLGPFIGWFGDDGKIALASQFVMRNE